MINPKANGERIVVNTKQSDISTYQEVNGNQSAEYKIVNAHPIIGKALDKLAFFRTHASAVWYNKLAGVTVLQKIDNLVNNIGVLAQLATTNKTSLVSAINELNENLANKANSNHTHNYAGSSSVGGSANSAVKLDSSAGSATQPVYFSGGKPVACTHTLGKSVPANAVFTDTNTKAIREIVNVNFTSLSTVSYGYIKRPGYGIISACIIASSANRCVGFSKDRSDGGDYVMWVDGDASGNKQCELIWMQYA